MVDPHGQRTLGVVTKADLATWGLRARLEATADTHLRMELGYVAVWSIIFLLWHTTFTFRIHSSQHHAAVRGSS